MDKEAAMMAIGLGIYFGLILSFFILWIDRRRIKKTKQEVGG